MKKIPQLFVAAALSIAASASFAQLLADGPALTRAEVLADLELYRQSGLAQLDDSPIVNSFSAEYQKAKRRYRELRASPRYAELVRRNGGPDLDRQATATTQAPAVGNAVQR